MKCHTIYTFFSFILFLHLEPRNELVTQILKHMPFSHILWVFFPLCLRLTALPCGLMQYNKTIRNDIK